MELLVLLVHGSLIHKISSSSRIRQNGFSTSAFLSPTHLLTKGKNNYVNQIYKESYTTHCRPQIKQVVAAIAHLSTYRLEF